MGSAGFTQQPLRGFVPYGELDPAYDWIRHSKALEIPFWEGADRPFLRSITQTGVGGHWIRPDVLGVEPVWSTGPPVSWTGAPHSGHIGSSIYTKTFGASAAGGWKYWNIWEPGPSVASYNYAILLVGEPMSFMNPDLTPAARGNSLRRLCVFRLLSGAMNQRITVNYATEQILWAHFGAASFGTPVIPFYGKRVAMLFVNGSEGGALPSPRVFIADEQGRFDRANFSTPGFLSITTSRSLELFLEGTSIQDLTCGGGCWEYFAVFLRAFEEEEAEAICRDAVGSVKMDPYVVRRIGWKRPIHHVTAAPGSFGRVAAAPGSFGRVAVAPTIYQRVAATPRYTGPRVAASPNTYPRVSARIRIADEEVFDVQATPLCPSEMNWEADNVLELADVLDDMQDPPAEITSADAVSCEIYDKATGNELTTVSPVALAQVGGLNKWRSSVLTNAANGFSQNQRLSLVFIFDGGAGLHGRFEALAVVASATS